jgi:hypothetical protein
MQPGWNVWEDVVTSFWAVNGTMKKKLNVNYIVALDGHQKKINHTQHTTINKKHAGATKEGQERMFDQHGAWGGARFDDFGDD